MIPATFGHASPNPNIGISLKDNPQWGTHPTNYNRQPTGPYTPLSDQTNLERSIGSGRIGNTPRGLFPIDPSQQTPTPPGTMYNQQDPGARHTTGSPAAPHFYGNTGLFGPSLTGGRFFSPGPWSAPHGGSKEPACIGLRLGLGGVGGRGERWIGNYQYSHGTNGLEGQRGFDWG